MATTVRVEVRLHTILRELASQEQRPIGQVIEDAIERYRKEKFREGVRADYERLRGGEVGWNDYQAEVTLLEGGSMDGLQNEEPYYTPAEEAEIRAEHARTHGR